MSQEVLQQDFEGKGKAVYVAFLDCIEAINLEFLIAYLERFARAEAVRHR